MVIPFQTTAGAEYIPLLRSLSVEPGSPPPVFKYEWEHYSVDVAHAVDSVVITAELENPSDTLTINGKKMKSGEKSGPIHVDVGRNIIPLELTASDGISKNVYTVTVKRMYPTPSWVKVEHDMPWPARDSAGELVFNNRMWLFGGYTPEVVNDAWSSADGRNWRRETDIPDSTGINIPVNLVFKDRMWIMTSSGKFLSSKDGKQWEAATEKAPWIGRYGAGGAVFKGRMWVMGGSRKCNDVWSSADGVDWRLETEHAAWSNRQLFSLLVVHDDKLWVLGGGITNYHPFRAYRDVWCSEDGKNWKKVTDEAPWPGRVWTTAAVYKNRMWVFGGFRAEPTWNNFNDAWYSSDGATWREFISMPNWSPRHELSAYVFQDRLWVVGGNAWPLMNDVWYLDIKGLSFLTQPVIEEFAGAMYRYRAFADFNESRKNVRYRIISGPSWLTVESETGLLTGTPDKAGDTSVVIEAYDSDGESARQSYTLHILP